MTAYKELGWDIKDFPNALNYYSNLITLPLDELPQVLDLISGDMSFVGTRPEAVKYVQKYKPEYYATLLLPAGITSEASIRYKDEAELITAQRIKHVEDRLGHDRRYGIDPTKIKNDLGWYPETPFEKGIVLTIDWYLENEEWTKDGKRYATQRTGLPFVLCVCQIMGWNPTHRYRILGRKLRSETNEEILLFDLKAGQEFEKSDADAHGKKQRSSILTGWDGTFGPTFGKNHSSLHVDTFDGYTYFSIKEGVVQDNAGHLEAGPGSENEEKTE